MITNNLSDIEALCNQISNSPYFRKQTPAELVQLQAMLDKVNALVRDMVPPLVTEVKQLRSLNKKLVAEIETLNTEKQNTEVSLSA